MIKLEEEPLVKKKHITKEQIEKLKIFENNRYILREKLGFNVALYA